MKSKPDNNYPSKHYVEKIVTVKTDEKVLHPTFTTKKETIIVKDKSAVKDVSPERPSHITTAKIQLSPTLIRKPSTPEIKKSPKSSDTKSKPQPSTVTSTIREITVMHQKSPTRPINEKLVPDKSISRPVIQKKDQTPVHPVQKVTVEKQTVTKFERNKTNTEKPVTQKVPKSSDLPSPKKSTPKKIPVVERKESAPINRVTEQQKYARSTSESLIKTGPQRTKPEIEISTTKSPRKNSTDKPRKNSFERRPSKCMTTKTINLTTTNTLMNSEDMENVIIDIQQAKSSREPSPNKIIPTPVPLDEDTGLPRYPDKVQEPDEHPRKYKVKNIPIFEEDSKQFVGCQITEVENIEEEEIVNKKKSSNIRSTKDYETTTKTTRIRSKEGSPVKDAEYLVPDETDECLLSVHDKVYKFTSTAEEVKKPKSSAPFRREKPIGKHIAEPDDCLLSVTDKVAKFLTTAENVTKPITSTVKKVERPNLDDLDEDLKKDECVLSVSEKVNKFTNTVEKLTESSYQPKSAELVAQIDRQISRSQSISEKEFPEEIEKSPKMEPVEKYAPQKPKSTEKLPKSPVLKSTEVIKKAKSVFERGNVFSSTPRQRDILSRPSVWEGRKTTTDAKLQDIGVYKSDYEEDDDDHDSAIDTEAEVCYVKKTIVEEDKEISKSKTKSKKPTSVTSDTVSLKKNIFENKISSSKDSSIQNSRITKTKTEISDRPKTSTFGLKSKPVETKTRTPEKNLKKPSDKLQRKQNETVQEISNVITDKTKHFEEYETHLTTTEKIVDKSDSASRNTTRIYREVSPKPFNKTVPTKRVDSPSREHLESPKTPKSQTPSNYPFNRQTSDAKKPSRVSKTPDSISAKRNLFEKTDNSSTTTNESRPSYMDHTVSSMEHRRDSTEITKIQSRRSSASKENEIPDNRLRDGNIKPVEKFGVELRRTNSKEGGPRRKSSCPEIPHIEDIFDLELLEQMLITVVGYEQRRRIRTQIRLVKKMIETQSKKENQILHKTIAKKTEQTKTSSRSSSKSPERYGSPSREEIIIINTPDDESTQIESKEIVTTKEEYIRRERSVSPAGKTKKITTVEEIRKIGNKPATKKVTTTTTEVNDGKPIWATKNILKKASENTRTTKPSSTSKSTVTSKTRTQREQLRTSEEDCITSSYGIGPTDEDGRPLFGIRALKKKSQPGETTKGNFFFL